MKIVVTGGAGFIGANLCRHLSALPDAQVVALDNLSMGRQANLDGIDATLVVGDLAEPDALDSVVVGADSIVHLGALGSVPRSLETPLATHHNNATGTLQVLEAARRHGNVHTVVASSSSVYGATPDLPKHEALPTRPMSPYGVSKLATEWYALAYQHALDLPTLAFRFFNVFGPLQPADHIYAAVVPRFIDAALQGRALTVHGDGKQSRDFTYVDTVCATITQAVANQVTSIEPVNLAFGQPHTLLDVIALLEELLDTELEVQHTEPRTGDIRHSDAASDRLYERFPNLTPTPLREGLEATISWFRSS